MSLAQSPESRSPLCSRILNDLRDTPSHHIPSTLRTRAAGALSPPPSLRVVELLVGIKYVCEAWEVLLLSQGVEI